MNQKRGTLLRTCGITGFCLVRFAAFSQQVGHAIIPADLLKATIVIERMEVKEVTRYVAPTNVLAVIEKRGTNAAIVPPEGLFTEIRTNEITFSPIGSGVLVGMSNFFFTVTANHVIPQDENVFFRIPQLIGKSAVHRPSKIIRESPQMSLKWVRSTNADVALIFAGVNAETDDIKVIKLEEFAATYDNVSIGDEIFVAGYPSSVVSIDDPTVHIIRSGIISSKMPGERILVDVFTFPGDSGGPVFWKPSFGFPIGPPKLEGRNPSLVGIVITSPLYSEGAVSPSSGRTRIVFEANAGLTEIVSTSRILELLRYPQVTEIMARVLAEGRH